MNRLRSLFQAATALGVCSVVNLASAQPEARPAPAAPAQASPDAVEAARAFAEAQALYDGGRYERACIKFEESLKKRSGIGIKFNLADCWERIGRTASAHELFLDVAEATKKLGQTERETIARDRAATLAPKLSRLQIQTSGSIEGVEVLRNGVKLDPAALGVPFAVDPGAHEVQIRAPGKKPWSSRISVPAEPAVITALVVPPLDDVEKVEKPGTATHAELAEEVPPQDEASMVSTQQPDTTRHDAALVLVGVGVVGVAVGGAMAAQYFGSRSDAEDVCPSARNCTPAEVSLHDTLVEDARRARTWTFVGFGVGGAALMGAAYLHLTAPSRGESPHLVAAPLLADSTWGAAVSGRFW